MGPVRLLDEGADPALAVLHRKAVAQRLLVPVQGDSHCSAAFPVGAHKLPQFKVAGRVRAYDEKVLIAVEVGAVFHRPGGAQSLLLHPVFKPDAQAFAVAEIVHDILRPVFYRRADLIKAAVLQMQQYMLHNWLAQNIRHGLGPVPRHRAKPRPHSPGHNNCFHVHCLLFTLVLA